MSLVLVNGVTVGAANVSLLLGGLVVTGIKSLELNYTQEKGNVEGWQHQPIGRERKLYKYEPGTLEILLEEWKAICAVAPNRDPLQIPMFNIPVVYDNGNPPSELICNAEFTGVKRSYKSGDGALWVVVGYVYAGLNQ
jgi:hypothetical protein